MQGELTVEQAADVLNVSPEFVVRLLDEGAIPSHGVGEDRRVAAEDVEEFRRADDERRRAAADELGRLGQELDT
ncbi:helix-turn-helix domain-containing protein [Nonomuraea phyllanthi]|uniref:helix-turn-helix domain-containing protein n=1 Tax=Nonomuraea phyllanthi TaxID=2219224 RepID=UPI001D15C989|nr:helix-turn-helix domain-containing protein [Nonomuraea phyllanthi]